MTGPIAIVATGELFGGAERHILGLGAFLSQRGLDPRIVLFHDRELAHCCREDGLPVTIIPPRSAYDLRVPRRLGQYLAQHGIRLVHVHGYKAAVNTALAPGRFGMVCTLHGQGEPNWRNPKAYIRDVVYRGGEVWSCRQRKSAVCFVTEDLKQRHGHRYGSLDLFTVHNGIDPLDADDLTKEPGLAPDRLHALMVGRLSPVKGIEFTLQAMARLAPDHRWQLNLVGEGSLRTDLEAMVSTLGIRDRVTFLGFRRDVYDLMAHSDLLIMSSHHEGLPYTLLEAMSLGKPTLASDIGGLAEVLVQDETGILVPVGDVDALAAGLTRLGEDDELRHRLGAKAAQEQRARYTLDSMGEGYLQAYRAVDGTR